MRRAATVAVLLLAFAAEARADWMFTPFVGTSFGTNTSQVILEAGAANAAKLTFGGSAALLSQNVLGVEADFGYAPHFFERDAKAGTITASNALTLSGNVIAAVPLSITRESLRPYVTGGLGLIHSSASEPLSLFSFDENNLGMNIGGGAVGLISPRTGFRFEIRQFRTLQNGTNALTGVRSTRLSFWRASVGVVIRFAN
jgi:opacity protein-like surface antigen